MTAKVYFIAAALEEGEAEVGKKAARVLEAAGLLDHFQPNDFTAVKVHVGEKRNVTYLPPAVLKPTITAIKQRKTKPFLTDTSTLYSGQRSNAVDHLVLARAHGYELETAGAPFFPADGLYGDTAVTVPIEGELYTEISMAEVIDRAQSLLVVSHATGHPLTGLGGCIKNLGMGCTSRKGKRQQHCNMTPAIKKSCTGCGECVALCPVSAITLLPEKKAAIDGDKCIGCGQCLTVCRFAGVSFDWGVGGPLLQKRVAEHALGVIKNKRGRMACMTFALSISVLCDCISKRQAIVASDHGIFVSHDPVAVDRAVLDRIQQVDGQPLQALIDSPEMDPLIQINHGKAIGLGTDDYDLIEV